MKTCIAYIVAFAAVANAFQAPMMATRAVKPVKAATKAVKAAKKAVKAAKKAAAPAPVFMPSSDRKYPVFEGAQNFKLPGISGGGNRAPPKYFTVPDFSNPALQIERDPAFYAAAAQQRLAKIKGSEFAYEDGLTDLERKQRVIAPSFLTGSAKSAKDQTAIRDDIVVAADDYFGLGPDRFQLLFISVFGLFTLVGCLSGSIKL